MPGRLAPGSPVAIAVLKHSSSTQIIFELIGRRPSAGAALVPGRLAPGSPAAIAVLKHSSSTQIIFELTGRGPSAGAALVPGRLAPGSPAAIAVLKHSSSTQIIFELTGRGPSAGAALAPVRLAPGSQRAFQVTGQISNKKKAALRKDARPTIYGSANTPARQATEEVSHFSSEARCVIAPTCCATTLPPLNTNSVGMARTL